MNAAQTPGRPQRRRIAGEVKPADVSSQPGRDAAQPKLKLPKPKLPKRSAPGPVPATPQLPSAPPRLDAPRVPRRKPSALLVALVILALGSIGFGAYGVWRGVDEWRGSNVAEARADATDAAAGAAEEIFSYRYTRMPEHLRQIEPLMSPRFIKKYRVADRALRILAPQRKIQMKAVVRNAAAKECGERCSPGTVTVLVFLDEARVADGVTKPTVFTKRFDMRMVERDGTWLVDDMKAL